MAESTPKKSKTAPAYAAMLRNIMFLSRVTDVRNQQYQAKLKAHLDSKRTMHPDLSAAQLKKAEEGFTRDFYKHEYMALNEFEVIKEKHDTLVSKRDAGGALSKQDESALKECEYHLSLRPEGFAAQAMMRKDTIGALKKEYPDIQKGLSADIKGVAAGLDGLEPRYAHMPATVELFKKEFPGLEVELKQMSQKGKTEDRRMLGKAAMAMLKAGSAYANPSGVLISKAVGAILGTNACRKLTANIGKGVSRAANKTGLSGWVQKQLSKVPETSLKRIAAGVAVVGTASLVGLGLMEPEKAMELAGHIKENVVDFAANTFGNEQAVAGMSNDGVRDNADMRMLDDAMSTTPPESGSLEVESTQNDPAPDAPPSDPTSDMLEGILGDDEQGPEKDPSLSAPELDTPDGQDPQPPAPSVEEIEQIKTAIEQSIESSPPSGEYTVVSGDTLSQIAEQQFIDAGIPYDYELIEDRVNMIAEKSGIPDPDHIQPGQALTFVPLPPAESLVTQAEVVEKMASDIALHQAGCDPRVVEDLDLGAHKITPEANNDGVAPAPLKLDEEINNPAMHHRQFI